MENFISVVILETKNLSTGVKSIEETFLQVLGNSESDVREKSITYGKSCENTYENHLGEKLQVSFVKVDDINPVLREEFDNDVKELYSRSFKILHK